jgi:hypothetical protein
MWGGVYIQHNVRIQGGSVWEQGAANDIWM